MAEVRGQEVESDRDGAVRAAAGRIGIPGYGKSVEGRFLQLDLGFSKFVVSALIGIDVFDGEQSSSALVGFVRASTLLPQLPTGSGACPLLLILKGHADVG